jgi:ribosomal protein S18 acetylase RimI-like enzyme
MEIGCFDARRPDVGHFAQFVVEPRLQNAGIGSAFLCVAERHAIADGKTELSCDTATGAAQLIEYYKRRGFREIGTHKWPHAVYRSVVLSKSRSSEP